MSMFDFGKKMFESKSIKLNFGAKLGEIDFS